MQIWISLKIILPHMQQAFIEIATAAGKINSDENEYEGNTKEENNGYVVFKWLSIDLLGIGK